MFENGHVCQGGGRPTTTISRPSHILLIFSFEPPWNPPSSNIIFFKCQTLADKILFENLAILEHKLNIEFAQKNFICEIKNFLCNFFFTNKHLYSSGKDEDFEVAWTRKEENVFSTRNCCSCSSSPPIRLHNNGPGWKNWRTVNT